MKSYVETADSGLAWLGRVPAHWQRSPLGSHFEERSETVSDADFPALSVTKDGVVPQLDNVAKTINNDNRKLVLAGDFAINSRSDRKGSSGLSDRDGSVSVVYTVLKPRPSIDGRFAHHLLRSAAFQEEFYRWGSGIVADLWSTRYSAMKRIQLALPSLDEQCAIADYLDRETARIDTLIEEQQRLIEMLRERREATIRSALLCGLDDVETTPSGVELLGAVPKHWRMVPTRYLCTITTGSEDSGNATDDGEYPFYVRGREVLRIDRYSFEGEAVMTPGDGQGGTGKVFHYFNGKFEAHQRVYVFTDFTDVTGWYFYYFLSTFLRPVALAGSNTVTMESLRRPLLADFKIAVPPIDEQQRITAYLDDQTAKIDTLIAEAERFIELARERRAALITAAVTGQIDVREMA
ncbi:restriction endonuclease subunit S [Micromonospora gifhornensis]|uniref:Restriction modification system DNA specificity domain-containing protein n=1 Tax=Micromonospora gifhornensis TaxID=84594 RepID=A0ABQ4IE72_9ACTN|nr:restriction endonuclease subunit S [Micromonospora gifhornensis]GIJ16213.1 restriction modification system DNA specificity domain-containing protein [Micromonospora gifhornensis]